jgi:hypothetical protein
MTPKAKVASKKIERWSRANNSIDYTYFAPQLCYKYSRHNYVEGCEEQSVKEELNEKFE